MSINRQLRRDIAAELSGTGLAFQIVGGGRHDKIVIEHRLVGIIPRGHGGGSHDRHSRLNVLAQIRRFIRQRRSLRNV